MCSAGLHFFRDVTLFFVGALFKQFVKNVKTIVNVNINIYNMCNITCSFRANYVTVSEESKWPTHKNFYRFLISFYVFYGYIFNEIVEKMQE